MKLPELKRSKPISLCYLSYSAEDYAFQCININFEIILFTNNIVA